ncbi:hypothetical protein Pan216_38380 [Planctomycetes bacterium Pan216]|uniref:Uncharacterized protein n=1 Tax=Kolteria novifilia TaxID=2527975 RepID=A0A518B7L1_9BACT|nr:hypothetical protein Pan216_38380 [Planctomycetes bacterium Pan216]
MNHGGPSVRLLPDGIWKKIGEPQRPRRDTEGGSQKFLDAKDGRAGVPLKRPRLLVHLDGAEFFNGNAVGQHSPGSRSAPWVTKI